eukprot:1156134-Pelagomonas_calceolata.AAC.2
MPHRVAKAHMQDLLAIAFLLRCAQSGKGIHARPACHRFLTAMHTEWQRHTCKTCLPSLSYCDAHRVAKAHIQDLLAIAFLLRCAQSGKGIHARPACHRFLTVMRAEWGRHTCKTCLPSLSYCDAPRVGKAHMQDLLAIAFLLRCAQSGKGTHARPACHRFLTVMRAEWERHTCKTCLPSLSYCDAHRVAKAHMQDLLAIAFLL